MRIIRDYTYVNDQDRGASAAIGNFDGVHLGHRSVIDLARAAAPAAPLGVMTFEPHPRKFFAPESRPFRITSLEQKAKLIEGSAIDYLFVIDFDQEFANISPEDGSIATIPPLLFAINASPYL